MWAAHTIHTTTNPSPAMARPGFCVSKAVKRSQ